MPIGNSDAARKEILARIRKAQGRGAASRPSQAELATVETYIAAHPRGPLPDVEDDLVARFRARAEAMQSTTEEVERLGDVPAATARYLAANGLPSTGCVWPRSRTSTGRAPGSRSNRAERRTAISSASPASSRRSPKPVP